MASALGVTPAILEEAVVSASAAAGLEIRGPSLIQALVHGFSEVFEVEFEALDDAVETLERRV